MSKKNQLLKDERTETKPVERMKTTFGDVRTIEARTTDGKALSTIVRMSCEVWDDLERHKGEEIERLFLAFCQDVENLF